MLDVVVVAPFLVPPPAPRFTRVRTRQRAGVRWRPSA